MCWPMNSDICPRESKTPYDCEADALSHDCNFNGVKRLYRISSNKSALPKSSSPQPEKPLNHDNLMNIFWFI